MGAWWRPQVNTPPPGERGDTSLGWHLTRTSWRLLRARPVLFTFPAVSALVTTLTLLLAILAGVLAGHGARDWVLLVSVLVLSVPASCAIAAANLAFLTMVQAHLCGEEPRVADGLAAVRARGGAAVRWILLTLAVGPWTWLSPGARRPGHRFGWMGGLPWGVATTFVPPVLALEERGARDSLRHSAALARERWGTSATGRLEIAQAFGWLSIPSTFCLSAGLSFMDREPWSLAVPLLLAGALWSGPVWAASTSLTHLVQLVLYRESVEGVTAEPFTAEDTAAAMRLRSTLWRR